VAAGEREIVTESEVVRRLAVSSSGWLDVSLCRTMNKSLPEPAEKAKRKPAKQDSESRRVDKEWNA